MTTATVTYNNLVAKKNRKITVYSKGKEDQDLKFLALSAQLEEIKNLMGTGSKDNGSDKRRGFSWRFLNDNNKTELQQNDKIYYWCNNDYHPRKQWRPRKNCLHKAEFKNQ